MTSFNLEDAIQLRNRLERCRETYHHEWESVRQRWQDLQYRWCDSLCHNFEPGFQRLVHNHDDVLNDLERQLKQLTQAILIIEQMNSNLSFCNSSATRITVFQNTKEQSRPSTKVPLSQPSNTTNSTSIGASSSPSSDEYNANKKLSRFALSLSYGHLNGIYEKPHIQPTFEKNDYGKLEALLSDRRGSDCYINYSVDNQLRVKIADIHVPELYRRKGVATLLFRDLEQRVPMGTQFFFQENKEEEFWESVGFKLNPETGEYYYIKR
jgi:GNAT superfamily N-acetyltransferase